MRLKGKLKLYPGAMRTMIYKNQQMASAVQKAAEMAKKAPSVKVKRYDDSKRWRVGVSDFPGHELKHGTVTGTVGGIRI
ncbi:hypothetical protein [Alloscardovia sp. HMSC034E08]|uniref:hypothetical protein n=1 Tax=Alloscardovia sp. HMSC034E08 TaxID=1739413 RepID=UPI0008AB21F6|nr:hypothetical protein [Alloscardovia sp. HMSC034E08]OFR01168.1 hypothetical protein HMPREF2909_00125 [Alloscardovia sp. HMSC034E08]